MGMRQEFKEFAMRGNVVDMAVGIVIGAAFSKIVKSFVDDILMPPIGLAVGGVDFTKLKVILKQAVGDTAAVSIDYGVFIQALVDFLIVAFAIFMVVKVMNSMKRKEEEKPSKPETPPKQEVLLTEIRDLLKK